MDHSTHHPTPEQCYKLAAVLRSVSESHPLNMMYGNVKYSNICGTTLCHGGAYYAAKNTHPSPGHSYVDGSNMMAYDLGFFNGDDISNWAHFNPDLWLNDFGGSMFSNEHAFENDMHPDGAETIADIADHWEMVGDKIKETFKQ